MKIYAYLFLALIIIFSCKDDITDTPNLSEDYGNGMYIVTDVGISYLDYKDSGSVVMNEIFKNVNNSSIINPKKIKIYGNRGYIVGNKLYVVNIKTFSLDGEISGFNNAVFSDVIFNNRLLVADKGESLIKVIDLEALEIVANIETGDSTKPIFIISNSIRSYVLNGG